MKKFFSLIAAVLFAGSMMAEAQVDLQYTGTTTVNMVGDGANNAALVGLDETKFTVLSDKGKASNHVGLNKAGDIRLYAHKDSGNGCTLTVNIAEGTILSIALDIKQSATFVVKAGENVVTEAGGSYAINASSFSIQNTTTGATTQLQLNKITIVHDGEGGGIPVVYDTLTVAEAIAIADTLKDNTTSAEKYYIEGFAVNVTEYSTVYNNQDFFMVADVNAPDSVLQAYRATPKKDGKAYAVLAGDEVRAFGKLKKFVKDGKTQLEIDQPSIEFIKETEGDHTIPEPKIDTISVTRALEIGRALESGKTSADQYVIDGYVTALTDSKGVPNADGGWEQYKNQCMWVADSLDEAAITKETAFFVYQGVAPEQVTKGAKIRFTCAIKNYNGMIETAVSKGAITILEKGGDPVVPPTQETIDTITVARALEIGAALEAGKTSDSVYVIAGYVSRIVTPYDAASKNETFWMVDSMGGRAATNAAGAFEVYRGKMDTIAELDAKVYVTAKILKYQPMKDNQPNGNPVIETASNPIPEVQVAEAGHAEIIESITVAQAVEIGKALEVGAVSDARYEITGYVSSIVNSFDEQYKNETFWIADSMGSRAASSEEGAFEVYRGKPNTGAEVGLFAKVKLVCYIKNYNGTIENDGSNLTVEVLEPGFIPDPDTISVAQAVEIAQKLEPGKYSADEYVVVGYAVSVYEKNTDGSWTFYMADDADVKGELQAAKCKTDSDVVMNDYMYVRGKISKYNSQGGNTILQIYQGKGVHGVAPEIPEITVAEALELAKALTPEAGKSVTTEGKYAIKGYVIEVEDEEEYTFVLSDDPQAESGEFRAFKCASIDAPVAEGELVIVTGRIETMNIQSFYSYYVNAGVLKHYAPEGVEQVVLTEKVQKVMIDGAIYIIRNGKMYDVRGAQVR